MYSMRTTGPQMQDFLVENMIKLSDVLKKYIS